MPVAAHSLKKRLGLWLWGGSILYVTIRRALSPTMVVLPAFESDLLLREEDTTYLSTMDVSKRAVLI
jgi:hypothetical protein